MAKRKAIPFQARQGDVFVFSTDEEIPQGYTLVGDGHQVILARGEVTGHHHAIAERVVGFAGERPLTEPLQDGDVELFAPGEASDLVDRFMRVRTRVLLRHQEHRSIVLEPRTYRVRGQRQYMPKELPRRVAD